jgi:hypothetical protein
MPLDYGWRNLRSLRQVLHSNQEVSIPHLTLRKSPAMSIAIVWNGALTLY